MVITTVQQQESRLEQDISAVKRSQNYQHNTGLAENYGQDLKDQRDLAHQAENANIEKEQR
jgi:hypothetical protein